MTQQINLYIREVEEKRGPAVLAAIVIVLAIALLVSYWQYTIGENKKLEAQVVRAKADLATQQAALKSVKDELAKRTDPARLATELAAVKARASQAQEFLALLQRGDLGSIEGYGRHLTTMARVGEPGVWLTGLRIHNAGRTIELEGRSLQAESVLRYAGELNRRVADYGASLKSVELTPLAGAEKMPPAISFKLF